jgi:hypothetical protein
MEKKIDEYTMLKLDEFKGTYQLIEGWETRDGSFKPNFCSREIGPKSNRREQKMPVNVKLGEKSMAIQVCLEILNELTGKWYK